MKLIILFSCFMLSPLQGMQQTCKEAMKLAYDKAWVYARSGNFHGFKTIVTKHDLKVDEKRSPLMVECVISNDDIENSILMVEFCKERGANFAVKNHYSGSTILHQATHFKNVGAVEAILQNDGIKSVLYDRNNEGETVLSSVFKRTGSCAMISVPYAATVAALKKGGYELKNDPLYRENKLHKGLLELWNNEDQLTEGLREHQQRKDAQQALKNEIREILKAYDAMDINVSIFNFGFKPVAVVQAARYDEKKCLQINSNFTKIDNIKPIILHHVAHLQLGHTSNHIDCLPIRKPPLTNMEFNKMKETEEKMEDEADDFAIQADPEEFIKSCKYFSSKKNEFHRCTFSRSSEERIARAQEYLKNK